MIQRTFFRVARRPAPGLFAVGGRLRSRSGAWTEDEGARPVRRDGSRAGQGKDCEPPATPAGRDR